MLGRRRFAGCHSQPRKRGFLRFCASITREENRLRRATQSCSSALTHVGGEGNRTHHRPVKDRRAAFRAEAVGAFAPAFRGLDVDFWRPALQRIEKTATQIVAQSPSDNSDDQWQRQPRR
jgi:hypothetical protein